MITKNKKAAETQTRERVSLSHVGKLAIDYLAEQIESGEISIPDGVLYRNSKKGV